VSRKFLTPIVLPADPAVAMEAATKQYVDSKAGGGSEVEIGPSDPIGTNPSAELWYDDDAVAPLNSDMRWYTSWGVIGQAKITSQQTGITTVVTLTGSTITASLIAGRRYLISATLAPVFTTVDTVGLVYLRAGGSAIQTRALSGAVIANVSNTWAVTTTYDAAASGSVAFDVAMAKQGGAGTVGNYADGGVVTVVTVEDVGPTGGTNVVPRNPTCAGSARGASSPTARWSSVTGCH
jgi:hypothetical protein